MSKKSTLELANQFLSAAEPKPLWATELEQVYKAQSLRNKAIMTIDKFINANSDASAKGRGLLIGTTVTIIKNALAPTDGVILPSRSRAVMALLKDHKRVIQIGGGVGVALFVLNTEPIVEETVPDDPGVDGNDPVALAKAMKNSASNLVADIKDLRKQLEEKDKMITQKDAQIADLKRQCYLTQQATWT
jgi:hypothetical protein